MAATLAAGMLFTLAWGAVSASANSTGSISGTVTAAATGHAPLEGILVCAWTLDEEDDECDLTASDGAYTIANLPAGSYKVDFWGGSNGYISQYYDGKSSWIEADVVPVSEEATTGGIDAELVLGGTITGTVIDATTHAGIAGFNVCASDGSHESCEETDVDGNYTITGLPEGDYIVYFEFFDDSDYV
ncbi:MAG: carboxypeptidase regulatory-like domain-containing protein, partial [Pantoea agglomerans]